jgi:hypoxanthine phosphoribosyltransferase
VQQDLSPADAGLSNCSIGAPALRAHRLRIRQNRIRGFASARYSFESPADAGLSNCSIGAEAPAAAFGKTAFAVLPQRGILMSEVEVKEGRIEVLISEEKVQERIRELGEQISKDYAGKSIQMICILKGASVFMVDLAKRITVPVYMDFMSVSSYGSGTESSGIVKINKDLDDPIVGKDVLIIEDIIDTGRTLNYLKKFLKNRGASSIKIATLLDKPARRVISLTPEYVGFTVPDEFVIGCGMDYDQRYRNLPYIGVVRQ